MKFLKALTETPGVAGREERVRALIRKEAADAFDEWREDPKGNLIGVARPQTKPKGGRAPRKVMLACHLDEIGFYVKHVDEQGFLRLQQVGEVQQSLMVGRGLRQLARYYLRVTLDRRQGRLQFV